MLMLFKPKMTLVFGVRALLSLQRSSLLPIISRSHRWTSTRVQCSDVQTPRPEATLKQKVLPDTENPVLLQNLSLLGVDLSKARRRQPGVLRKQLTNEQGVAAFLRSKGASPRVIAGIFSRYPRSITRTTDHLEQRWALWRLVFASDAEVVEVLDRSPESFFRSSDNENLAVNITFLSSLGFGAECLHRLLTTAPRAFSNSVELNRQMVELLEDVGAELGLSATGGDSGQTPAEFAMAVVRRNAYVLATSTKRVRRNVELLRELLQLSDAELLALLQGPGGDILDLSNTYLSVNFESLRCKMESLGCGLSDVRRLVFAAPMLMFTSRQNLSTKLDCLMQGGVSIQQVLERPKVLYYGTQNIASRIAELRRTGYDIGKNGIGVFDTSRKRFDAKMAKLNAAAAAAAAAATAATAAVAQSQEEECEL